MIGNGKGGFLNLSMNSKYRGFFVKDKEVWKIFEDTSNDGKIENEIYRLKRNSENFYLPKGFNTLMIESRKKRDFFFDIRKAYDLSEWGREYTIRKKGNKVIIKCRGMCVVCHVTGYEKTGDWVKRTYEYDRKRNSPPVDWWVYSAFKAKKAIITAYKDEKKALAENNIVVKGLTKIKKNEKNSIKKDRSKYVKYAKNALNNLITQKGIMAGLPWFFQIWTRDEMISMKALTLMKEQQLAKKFLMKRLEMINEKGRLPNRMPSADLDSADSIGWMFFRFNDVLKLLNKKEKQLLKIQLKNTIENQIKHFHKDGFYINGAKETWMDTSDGDDTREGARIEIQALMMSMFDLAYKLTKEKMYLKLRDSLVKNVKERFYHNGYLKDGLNDAVIRPNAFIACYIYPKMLTKKEWENCFDYMIKKLWLEWGGFATIDKNHPLFTPLYTGEDTRSYHRGDSWYWINCLAAICLKKHKKYDDYVNKIIDACKKDLEDGMISEVSSANKQTFDGCLNQAWSNAMFIELMKSK